MQILSLTSLQADWNKLVPCLPDIVAIEMKQELSNYTISGRKKERKNKKKNQITHKIQLSKGDLIGNL